MIFTVKMAFNMEIIRLTTLYGENSNSDHAQIQFKNKVKITVKVANNMETVKMLKHTKIYG